MTLMQAIAAAGMTPPPRIVPGRWVRFPGIGKGKSNRAGWCRLITPTLAIFGDWSSSFRATWRDDAHRDDEQTKRLLEEARRRERAFAAEQRRRQAQAADRAKHLIRACVQKTHPYLERKGFPHLKALVHVGEPIVPEGKEILGHQLVIPMRDALDYERIVSAQLIDERGEKVFLPGGRAMGAVFCIGAMPSRAKRLVLCEGYATALSIDAALARLPGPNGVIACFSADNLVRVAEKFPRAVVGADNDLSAAGEEAAKRTGLRWTMPYEVGTDWNDVHRNLGLHVVVERMRELIG